MVIETRELYLCLLFIDCNLQ